jgi:nitrogen regulatory protein PII
MKKIELVIEAHKVSEVCAALTAIGVTEVVASEVHAQADLQESRLEIVVSAERAAEVIRTFASAGWSDLLGDEKIVVYELGDPVRVHSPESHENVR